MRENKLSRLIVIVLGILAVSFGLGPLSTSLTATVPGTGSVSGTVDAPLPFQAAQVYVMNVDEDILYMVYTVDGQYEAVNLLPGNYEINVRKTGLTTDFSNIVVTAGSELVVNF